MSVSDIKICGITSLADVMPRGDAVPAAPRKQPAPAPAPGLADSKGAEGMPGRVEGKVAFITGAGRGQGRSHAIRLAEEGADIIAVDICEDYKTVGYGMSTEHDLADTVKQVEALDRRIIARKADVRDAADLKNVVDTG